MVPIHQKCITLPPTTDLIKDNNVLAVRLGITPQTPNAGVRDVLTITKAQQALTDIPRRFFTLKLNLVSSMCTITPPPRTTQFYRVDFKIVEFFSNKVFLNLIYTFF